MHVENNSNELNMESIFKGENDGDGKVLSSEATFVSSQFNSTEDPIPPNALCDILNNPFHGKDLTDSDISRDETSVCINSSDSSSSPSDDQSIAETSTDGSFSPKETLNLLLKLEEVIVPAKTRTESELKASTPPTLNSSDGSYISLRVTYLLVTLVIMLADGLQGTHLYVLYEGYGFSVASLYCLGFVTGGFMSPITGPMVDKIGRKKSAILYCALEIFINKLEQYPYLPGLIASRMIGGFTTNLLSSVFETWLDTEYRRRGFAKEKYEIIMRDSVIVSNMAAIFSGYLSHTLAEHYGAVGPFEGAVTCTAIALIVVCFVWTENYGTEDHNEAKDMVGYFKEAVCAFRDDHQMRLVGILQGLTTGCIHIFVFLWAPTLRHFSQNALEVSWGLDKNGEPAYGLIFGAFMSAGVLGGLAAPRLRQCVTSILSPIVGDDVPMATVEIDSEGEVQIRPMAVEFLASACYFLSALLMFVPYMVAEDSPNAFSYSLWAFLAYEFLIGIFLPSEGVIRSLYFPANARASIMTLPRIIVNVAVALGVVSTNYISMRTAFLAVGCVMLISGYLQQSLISEREWSSLFSRMDRMQGNVKKQARRVSFNVQELIKSSPIPKEMSRRVSDPSEVSFSSSAVSFDYANKVKED